MHKTQEGTHIQQEPVFGRERVILVSCPPADQGSTIFARTNFSVKEAISSVLSRQSDGGVATEPLIGLIPSKGGRVLSAQLQKRRVRHTDAVNVLPNEGRNCRLLVVKLARQLVIEQ